ncbi:MAG TPA: hypothetical protein ENO00_04375 [Deltaproteobacteria bacterium]|nr:hypothetical protein [Deltaproteobacteria bacterium]
MRSFVVFTATGSDRPGLANEFFEFFTARGMNIERTRGCVLGNEFGMIILTSGKTDDVERLINDVDGLRQRTGLEIHVRKTKAPSRREVQPSIPYKLIATSIDHPGIIHQISKVLCRKGINIDDISTNVDSNPITGTNVFSMSCYFYLPPTIGIFELRKDLDHVSDQYNLDIRFDAVIHRL